MVDKYSKVEEKVEEGKKRGEAVVKSLEIVFGVEKAKLEEFLTWEMVSVKTGEGGVRN
jgi:hypothetical protein